MSEKIFRVTDVGKVVEFNYSKVWQGNPVKGTLHYFDKENIQVQLHHDITDYSMWEKGEMKFFTRSQIIGPITVFRKTYNKNNA